MIHIDRFDSMLRQQQQQRLHVPRPCPEARQCRHSWRVPSRRPSTRPKRAPSTARDTVSRRLTVIALSLVNIVALHRGICCIVVLTYLITSPSM
uniref:Uncharacterized protein n=1 Tax=Panagrellus redivivus TaxID=6233 RepID=A0A7E4V9P6_PANRE